MLPVWRGDAGGLALGTCMLSRVTSFCWSLQSSSVASRFVGFARRHRCWPWFGIPFDFFENSEKFLRTSLSSPGAPSRDRVLLGCHLLWRSVFTGAGLAALGRFSLLLMGVETAGGVMTKLTERNTIILTASNRDVHDECCQPVGSPHFVNVSFVALSITVM